MKVLKFGGTSVGDAERIRTACSIVKGEVDSGRPPLTVVSAHSGVTDMLIKKAECALKGDAAIDDIMSRHLKIIRDLGLDPRHLRKDFDGLADILRGISLVGELTPRTLDHVMSFGERMSSKTFAAALRKAGLKAEAEDSYDLGFLTNSNFGSAIPDPDCFPSIKKKYEEAARRGLIVTTGFIGKNARGEVTTIGRGGSDYSAALFGAALGADEIQIWTDVDGVMTADPSLVPNARSIDAMSYEEANELAYFGGRVLHPSTILPAIRSGIPVRVLNTFRPEHPGTVIVEKLPAGQPPVKSIVYKENLTMINVVSTRMLLAHGFMAKLFGVFEKHGIVIDMIATSEVSVSLTTDTRASLEPACEELSRYADVAVSKGRTIVCAVGSGLRETKGMSGRIFGLLAAAGVEPEMISFGASRINIAFLVRDEEAGAAVKALHKAFFEERG